MLFRSYVQTFFAPHFDYDVLFGFGTPWRCVEPGMAIKFYPSKYPTHFAITAALEARKTIKDVAPNGIVAEFQRFYFDTAQAHSAPAMAAIMKLTTVSKLVFGSDFPYYTEDDTVNGLEKAGFSTADLNKIYYENAYGLVPRLKA